MTTVDTATATVPMKSEDAASDQPNNHIQNTIRVRALKSLTKTDRDDITDFNNLRDKLTKKLKLDNWIVVNSSQTLYIFNLNRKPNGNLSIGNTISIDNDLTAKVFYDENLFDSLKLFRWPQLVELVEQFRNNVKREDDCQFECVGETKTNIEFQDCYESKRELDTSIFEFCAVNIAGAGNADTVSGELHQPLSELSNTKTSESLPLHIKNEPTTYVIDPTPLPYKCSECDKAYDHNVKLLIHKRVHQSRFCPICNEHYTGRVDRHVHYKDKLSTSSQSYICTTCGKERKSKASLEKHMQDDHSTNAEEFHCDICKDTKFELKVEIEWHMKHRHNNEGKNVEHMQMDYVRVRKEQFEKQIALEKSDPNRTIVDRELLPPKSLCQKHLIKKKLKQCPLCHKFLTNLSRHIADKHRNTDGYICDICGSTFANRTAVRMHVKRKHTEGENLYCDICKNGQAFHNRAYLRKHLAAHAGSIAKRMNGASMYQCERCNEEFPSKYTLQCHNTLHHSEAPQFKCKQCDKLFGNRNLLTSHEKLHSGILHTCSVCSQSFKHPKYLKKHVKRHDEVPPKKPCTMCDKQYANGFDLRMHMKKVHGVVVEPMKRVYAKKVQIVE